MKDDEEKCRTNCVRMDDGRTDGSRRRKEEIQDELQRQREPTRKVYDKQTQSLQLRVPNCPALIFIESNVILRVSACSRPPVDIDLKVAF